MASGGSRVFRWEREVLRGDEKAQVPQHTQQT
jgi:hypothetical protein